MDLSTALGDIRILAYAVMAVYMLFQRRWLAWFLFSLLIWQTYTSHFTDISELGIELIRTFAGAVLIYLILRRK